MTSPDSTHDWTEAVDLAHLDAIRSRADELAPGGVLHLVLEVLAYAADEAAELGAGSCAVVVRTDGSIVVADEGRGTQTQIAPDGSAARKPVMSTRDLRFFDAQDPPLLPDGQARRGMSVVAALSRWLVHQNRRREGSWTQRYERGVPVSDLIPVPSTAQTGTTVYFLPQDGLAPLPADLGVLTDWPALAVQVVDERER